MAHIIHLNIPFTSVSSHIVKDVSILLYILAETFRNPPHLVRFVKIINWAVLGRLLPKYVITSIARIQ